MGRPKKIRDVPGSDAEEGVSESGKGQGQGEGTPITGSGRGKGAKRGRGRGKAAGAVASVGLGKGRGGAVGLEHTAEKGTSVLEAANIAANSAQGEPKRKRGRPKKDSTLSSGSSKPESGTDSAVSLASGSSIALSKRAKKNTESATALATANDGAAIPIVDASIGNALSPSAIAAPPKVFSPPKETVAHDWPPQPGQQTAEQHPSDVEWTSWEPIKFTPPPTGVQEFVVEWDEEDEQPLTYGCSWPAYMVHRFVRPRPKPTKPATVIATRTPMDPMPPGEKNNEQQAAEAVATAAGQH